MTAFIVKGRATLRCDGVDCDDVITVSNRDINRVEHFAVQHFGWNKKVTDGNTYHYCDSCTRYDAMSKLVRMAYREVR